MPAFIKRHKILTAFLLIIAAFAIFAATKWRIWFHNPAEQPYVVAEHPQWVLLTFGNEGEQSRNISWMCGDEVKPSYLKLVDMGKADTPDIHGIRRSV